MCNRGVPPTGASRGQAGFRRWSAPIALALLVAATSGLGGCGAVLLGGAAVGASTFYDRRPPQVVIDDERIELAALRALAQDPELSRHVRISATSYNLTVLLTGQADSADAARQASRLVSGLPKVQRVIDEVTLGPGRDLGRESEDVYITSRAKLVLTQVDLPDFNPIRVKVVTDSGVVYLMGLVSEEEADQATEQIRYIPGVKRVVKLFEYRTQDG